MALSTHFFNDWFLTLFLFKTVFWRDKLVGWESLFQDGIDVKVGVLAN